MKRKDSPTYILLDYLTDVLLIFLSYCLSVYFRYEILPSKPGLNLLSRPYLLIALLYAVLLVFAYYVTSTHTVIQIFYMNAIGALAFLAFLYIIGNMYYSRYAMAFFWLLSSIFISLKKSFFKGVLGYFKSIGLGRKKVVVVGNGPIARCYVQQAREFPEMGIKVIGYVGKKDVLDVSEVVEALKKTEMSLEEDEGEPLDEEELEEEADPEMDSDGDFAEKAEAPVKWLGTFEELEKVILGQDVDEIVVALESYESGYVEEILSVADKSGSNVSIIPFYNRYIPSHPLITSIGDVRLINLRVTPLDYSRWGALKRMFDIVFSLVALLLTLPISLLTFIYLSLSSSQPVLVTFKRIGKNHKPFQMLSFNLQNPQGGIPAFLYKLNVHNIPQFLHVLSGKMSVVGPRPEAVEYAEQYKAAVPLYLVRQQVRPGITGWAQVNANEISRKAGEAPTPEGQAAKEIEERVKLDVWYVENWSLQLDIVILLRTIFGGFVKSSQQEKKNHPLRMFRLWGLLLSMCAIFFVVSSKRGGTLSGTSIFLASFALGAFSYFTTKFVPNLRGIPSRRALVAFLFCFTYNLLMTLYGGALSFRMGITGYLIPILMGWLRGMLRNSDAQKDDWFLFLS